MPPTLCPAPNATFPVVLHRTRDGDTPEVKLPGGALVWAIRLADCWVPELHRGTDEQKKIARKAWAFANDVLEKTDFLRVYFELPEDMHFRNFNVLKLPTFDRLPGWLYVSPTQTLNRMLVARRLASSTKGGRLGE